MSDEPEERIQKIAEHHQVIAKILTCPICLELLLSPTRTKCGHVFCQGCLEDHIKKGKRGRTSCPMCNAEGITKRGLESDAKVTGLVAVFKKLLQAEKNDMGNVIDFMNIRIQRKGARESVATPLKETDNLPNKLPALQKIESEIHCSFSEDGDTPNSYGDILDTIGAGSNTDSADDKDKPANVSQHGIKKLKMASSTKPSPLSATPPAADSTKPSPLSATPPAADSTKTSPSTTPTLSTTPSLESGVASPVRSVKPSGVSRFWNKMKPKGPKTYSKSSTVSTTGIRASANPDVSRASGNTDGTRASSNTDASQIYPGEAVEGDKEWEEKRKTRNLPILAGVDREERVEEWLKTGVDGFASPESGQFVDFSSQPSLSQGTESTPSVVKGVRPSPVVSPLDGVAMRGEKVKFFKSKVGSLRKSPDASGLISKTILGKGTDDDLYKFQPSQATPPKPKGRGRGRGRGRGGKGKRVLKETESLPVDLVKKSGHQMTGKNTREKENKSMGDASGPMTLKGKRSSKDMYEQQNELWDDLNIVAGGESVENSENKGKNKKRNSKDMYEHQDELWGNLMNPKDDAVLKANDPVTEVNDKTLDASQMIPNSCPVIMDDTFDMVAAGAVTKLTVEKESQEICFEEDDENESCGLFQSPPDQLEGSEVVKVINKKSSPKKKESLEEFLNRDDKESQPLQVKKRVSWQDENNDVNSATKTDILTFGKENKGGKLRRNKKSPGWSNVTLAIGEMNAGEKQGKYQKLDLTVGGKNAKEDNEVEPVLNEREIDKTKENPEGSLTDSVPSVISNSQASKEDLTTKRRSFPLKKVELLKTTSINKDSVGLPSPISPMSGWSNEDSIEATMKRDGVAKLVAMEENGLEGPEAEVAALYSSTSTNKTSPGNAKNQTLSMECKNHENASNNTSVDSHHEKSSEGRMTFKLDVETMDLEEMAKPMDTMELVTQTITDSPIKCKTPTTARRSGRQKVTPKSILQSPSPGKTPQRVRSRRIAPMVGFGSPTNPQSSPTAGFNVELNSPTAQSGKKLGRENVISLSSSKKSSNASLETVLSGSTAGEKGKPFDALNPKASQSSDTVMSIGFTLSPAVEEKPAQTTIESNSPDIENISQNIEKGAKMCVRTPPKSKKAKGTAKISGSRFSFKLLGKVCSNPPANPRRERNVIFTQSGRLSERRHGPSLREIVSRAAYSSTASVHQLAERDQSTPAGSSKVRKWLQNLETPTSLLSGPRLAVEDTPTPAERVLVMETPTPATKRFVMETPTPADQRLAAVETPIPQTLGGNAVETPIIKRVPQMASIQIQTSQSLILREKKTEVEVIGDEFSMDIDEEKNVATPVIESFTAKVNGSNTKLKRKKGKPKKDPYENPKPGTSGLSSARVTRGKASKSNVSSTRIVEVARSHLDSDSDGGVAPLVRRRSSGSSGKKSSKLSVQGIMSRIVPGDSDDMRIDNIDTATSVEEDEEEKDKLKTSTISITPSKKKENDSDVEPDLPDLSQDKSTNGDDDRASTPNLANALGIEEDDLASALDIDELPDIDVGAGSHSKFMADILGESEPEVYSQDKETASEEVARLAKHQFEQDLLAATSHGADLGSRKRSRKMSNSSDDEPISIKKRKVNKIESDEEDAVVVSENSSLVKPISKLDSLRKKMGGGGFDNSFKNVDHQMEQDQEIEAIPSLPLTQTGYTAEEMDVPDVEERETMSFVVKHDQENDNFSAPLSNRKTTTSNRTVLGEVTNSPARSTAGRTSQSKGLTKLSMAGISSLSNCNQKEAESQMTRRSSSASSMATSTDSEDERTTQEIQRDVDATEMQIVKMKQQIVDGAEILASTNLADDLKENVFESQGEEIETVGESVSLLQHEPVLHETEEVGDNGGSSESQAGKTELPQREESIEVAETEDEESNKIVDSDDDLFISQTPEQSKPIRLKEKKPVAKLDTVVEIGEQEAATSEPSQPDTTNWKFVTTNLPAPARSLVSRWVESLKCKGMGSKIDEEVTHVIVSTGPDMQSQRTLKYLQAVASGKFVVSHLWVERATKLGSIPPEEEFEVKDEENGGANGPWRSRLAREGGKPGIFSRFEVFISEELEGLSKEAVEDLLVRAGARCLPDENAFSFSPQITGVIIADSAASMEVKVVNRRLRTYNLATVEKDWLLDSLGDWAPRPLLPYMMEQVNVEDLVAAGYTGTLTNAEI